MTQLTAHFSLDELTHTEQRQHDNTCPPELLPELVETALMMERIRAALSAAKGQQVPILVSSAYRSEAVNKAVGGSPRSDHVKAAAVDFKAPAFGTPYQVSKFLATHMDALKIGQVIHEFGRWVHVSRITPAKVFNRAITISRAGVEVGIQEVA
jgi:zinc D-Ala-D-Ala carboxypeptidase